MKDCCKTYLTEQFGDEEIVAEIYGEYKTSLSGKIAECEAAAAKDEWETLDRAAHAMKGNAIAAGDGEVADRAIALRRAAKLQDAAASAGEIAAIKGLYAQL